jgi:hypothetical protein
MLNDYLQTSTSALWSLVNMSGTWWWWGQALFAFAIFLRLFFMNLSTIYGRITRVVLWIGTGLMSISPWNSGLGPYAYYVILAGLFMMVDQLARCPAKPLPADTSPSVRQVKAAVKEASADRTFIEKLAFHVLGAKGVANIAAGVQHESELAKAFSKE